MKAIALLALAVALEAGFLFTLALPAAELDAAGRAAGARVVVVRSPAPGNPGDPGESRTAAAAAEATHASPSRS